MTATLPGGEPIDDMLSILWLSSRAEILDRVGLIQLAAERASELSDDERAVAEQAAHKLAGVAGTFGYWDASDLARDAEHILEQPIPLSVDDALRLGDIVAALYKTFATQSGENS